jgi:lysylphosphatidylglycerol synthetase-like protein (DUF2156 family)
MVADPLCSNENYSDVISNFIDQGKFYNKKVIGIQNSIETANKFFKHDYFSNHMGVETILDLKKWHTKGKKKPK